MKFSISSLSVLSLLFFLIICSIGNVIIQVFSILVFGITMIAFKGINNNKHFLTFYIVLILLSFIQLFYFFRLDYSIPYLINSSLITLMWILAFLAHNFITNNTKNMSIVSIYQALDLFFILNALLIAFQYLLVCIEAKTLFPFSVFEFGMSTGDYLRGFFSNSSVNMVVMSFYSAYYFTLKNKVKTFLSILLVLSTTYMSGILIAIFIVSTYGFLMFKLKNKFKIIALITLIYFAFTLITPENVKYAKSVLTEKINSKTDPSRKIVSFQQTASNFVSSFQSFFIGEGGGKFSSRTAYLTGGEYVNWFPEKLVYRSEKFEKNHFKLWNFEALKIAFRDGTANQPFSFYNKIVGEYGLIGILLFVFYIRYFYKRQRFLSYGKLILPLMLGFFVLDYWFEYFTVILFFELFMLTDIKRNENIHEIISK